MTNLLKLDLLPLGNIRTIYYLYLCKIISSRIHRHRPESYGVTLIIKLPYFIRVESHIRGVRCHPERADVGVGFHSNQEEVKPFGLVESDVAPA